MFRVIQDFNPRWVLGENVANFSRMALDKTLFDLEDYGYEAITFNLPACGVDAWHKRERVFIVASNAGYLPGSTEQIMQQEISQEPVASGTGQFRSGTLANSVGFEWSQLRNLSGMGWSMEQIAWFTSRIWESEPGVGRVVDGVSKGLDEFKRQRRCHALGNAVVPQQVYPILKAIADIERGEPKQQGGVSE
jgi:DNA (cytosine-5)-methyltransferase 1